MIDTIAEKTITLVVVALDEEILIEETVQSILLCVPQYFQDYEIILVNDGSTDNTGQLMDALAIAHEKIKVLHNVGNIGLGASFQRALKEAQFEYFMMLCGDGGLPAESLPAIFNQVGTVDIVIPYMSNLMNIKSFSRYWISRTYTMLLNVFFNQKLHYYNGLPLYRVALLQQIQIISSGFGFQGEILTKLLKAGCSYVEVEVLGSEKANRSRALGVVSFLNVTKTFINLVLEIALFNPSSIKRV